MTKKLRIFKDRNGCVDDMWGRLFFLFYGFDFSTTKESLDILLSIICLYWKAPYMDKNETVMSVVCRLIPLMTLS